MVIGEAAKRLNLTRTVFLLSVAREHAEHVPGKKANPGRGGMPAALAAGLLTVADLFLNPPPPGGTQKKAKEMWE
ncbi:hypothetical protein [Akkermansia sp.]|uniref:hypothetical protein n=1 Tax=Akkermansia sp. TaxID=1872421 RepID=UPI003AB1FA7E